MQQEHLFYWPDNSWCHANPSVLQVKEGYILSDQLLWNLCKLLTLSLCLDVFSCLPFWIWRTLASQCSPVVVYTQKNTSCLQNPLSEPCPPSKGVLHHVLINWSNSCYWSWPRSLPLCLTSLYCPCQSTLSQLWPLLTLDFPVRFSSRIQFAKGTPWIMIAFLGPVQAFLSATASFLVVLLGSCCSPPSRREPCATTLPLMCSPSPLLISVWPGSLQEDSFINFCIPGVYWSPTTF